jgi:hypothetical protein
VEHDERECVRHTRQRGVAAQMLAKRSKLMGRASAAAVVVEIVLVTMGQAPPWKDLPCYTPRPQLD